ncbi:MAG: DUF2071 domain-containing protein [Balneolales bacterium]
MAYDGACLKAIYKPVGEIFQAEPKTIDYWLIERYALYTKDKKDRLLIGNIHHRPWALKKATVRIDKNTMTRPLGISLPDQEPVIHYSPEQSMVAWNFKPV